MAIGPQARPTGLHSGTPVDEDDERTSSADVAQPPTTLRQPKYELATPYLTTTCYTVTMMHVCCMLYACHILHVCRMSNDAKARPRSLGTP